MEILSPPPTLKFLSLADLLQQYESLFVGRELRCPRGIRIIFEPYHFFHLVKLKRGYQTDFLMSQEREAILSTRAGFGEYEIDRRRAETLPWILDIIPTPHEIREYTAKRTADEVLIKEYLKSGSPFNQGSFANQRGGLFSSSNVHVRQEVSNKRTPKGKTTLGGAHKIKTAQDDRWAVSLRTLSGQGFQPAYGFDRHTYNAGNREKVK